MKPSGMTSVEKRDAIVKAADDKKANYITEIDLRGKTLIADFFVLCSGTSNIHIRSVADGILEALEKIGVRAYRTEGYTECTWVLLDYGDVIVHVMSTEERDKYKIERLWTKELKTDSSGQARLAAAPPGESLEDASAT
ncbi:MAG: ribosome silencing factor [Capsulimonadaceae bacterium]